MLHSNDLLTIETMPSWSDISLALYKEFSEQYLIPTIFRYYLENGEIIDVRFEEWAIYHILGIQHINGKISKTKFFEEIENGLDLDSFMENKKRLNDFKHRIRMFGCIYQIMKDEETLIAWNNRMHINPQELCVSGGLLMELFVCAVCINYRLNLFHQSIIVILIINSAEHRITYNITISIDQYCCRKCHDIGRVFPCI